MLNVNYAALDRQAALLVRECPRPAKPCIGPTT
jgi:hypothetical protein